MSDSSFSPEDIDAINALAFPNGFTVGRGARNTVRLTDLVTEYGPLDQSHIDIAQDYMDNPVVLNAPRSPPIQRLRHTHHRLAQLLAGGMDESVAEKLCNYSVGYASLMKQNPAFQELLAHYKDGVDTAFAQFNEAAADLSIDMLGKLREILDEGSEKLTVSHVLKAIEVLADRSGNGPQSRNLNVNVNLGLGDRLRSARERANSLLIEQGSG